MPCSMNDPGATTFCLVGALDRLFMEDPNTYNDVYGLLRALAYADVPPPEYAHQGLVYYNDTHTHSEVLDLVRRAIG